MEKIMFIEDGTIGLDQVNLELENGWHVKSVIPAPTRSESSVYVVLTNEDE